MYPELSISITPDFVHVADQIRLHARYRAENIAFIENDETLTWKEYNDRGDQFAAALVSAGVEKGDRVAMLVGNNVWSHELILGIWRAGAVVVPLSPLLTPDILGDMLIDAGAKFLFVDEAMGPLASIAAEKSTTTLVLSGADYEDFLSTTTDNSTAQCIMPSLKQDDLAVIIYSSGTTGVPKGIAHSHEGRLTFAKMGLAQLKCDERSVCLSMIPPHSNGAWLSWLPAKLVGATTVVLPHFTPDALVDVVRKYRPTYGFLVPAICAALLEHPDIESAGMDCFECAITAGAPMPLPMKEAMIRLTNGGLFELWGLTEGIATLITPDDMSARPNSVGRPLVGTEIRIINEQDEDITGQGTGEIVGRSAGVMVGYWNRPEATEALAWKDDSGRSYIRTGDIGEFDESGFLTLRGRAKDMIISGALNVFPVDIEAVLLEHASVKDAAVIGVEHAKWGETPVAFILLDEGASSDVADIKEWVNERLAKPQRLYDIRAWNGDFPRNTLGKVLKGDLKAHYIDSNSAGAEKAGV